MKLTAQPARQDAGHVADLHGSHTLIETAPLSLPDEREWTATLWKTPTRPNGRRIQVRDEVRRPLFDTGDHFDLANATNALGLWLDGQVKPAPSRVVQFELAAAG
jgi:hypothetical protein